MPTTPIDLRRPVTCPFCEGKNTVTLETMIQGDLVRLKWLCRQCAEEWNVQRKDAPVLVKH